MRATVFLGYIFCLCFVSVCGMNADMCVSDPKILSIYQEPTDADQFCTKERLMMKVENVWSDVRNDNDEKLITDVTELLPLIKVIKENRKGMRMATISDDHLDRYRWDHRYDQWGQFYMDVADAARVGLLKLCITGKFDSRIKNQLEKCDSLDILSSQDWSWFEEKQAEIAEPLEEKYFEMSRCGSPS